MKKDFDKKTLNKYPIYIKGFILQIIVTAAVIFLFAAVMLFGNLDYGYSTVFATLSVACGCFFSSFFCARKIGNGGYIVGLIIGGITFVVITLISLYADKGGITLNTLFHLIIIMLSSLIGGVVGVNKNVNKKYI